MAKYTVEIFPNFMSFDIEAESKSRAIDIAYSKAVGMSQYDLLMDCEYDVEEANGQFLSNPARRAGCKYV